MTSKLSSKPLEGEEKIENKFSSDEHHTIRLLKESKLPDEFYNSLADRLQKGDRFLTLLKKFLDEAGITSYVPASQEFRKVVADYYLKSYTPEKKCVKTLIRDNGGQFSEAYFERIFPQEYAKMLWFVVVGCPRSSDIDVIVIVDGKSHTNGKTLPLTSEDLKTIRSKLTAVGYDPKKEIDINVLALKDKKIVACFKGGKETANIIIHTADLHKQVEFSNSGIKYDSQSRPTNMSDLLDEVPATDEMIFGRVHAILKFIIEYLEIISLDYRSIRPEKMDVMATGEVNNMLTFVQKVMTEKYVIINHSSISDKKKEYEIRSFYKSVVMKILQLALIQKGKCYFTKDEIGESCEEIFENESKDNISTYIKRSRYYLFRGSCTWAPQEEDSDLSFIKKLFSLFYQMAQVILQKKNPNKIVSIPLSIIIDDSQDEKSSLPKSLSEKTDFIKLFFKSPSTPTEELEQFWKNLSKGKTVNDCFPLISSKRDDFLSFISCHKHLAQKLDDCIEFCNQRSPEWLKLLTEYRCGNNGGVIKDNFEALYNLIRGCILEQLAITYFDPESIGLKGYKKWSVGFLVEKKIKGARGFAPDLLVMGINPSGKMELITIEIKGLKSFDCSSDYTRGLNLASSQVTSARDILSKNIPSEDLVINRGIVLICSIKNGSFVMNHHFVDF
jgi:hypothetical protein